MKLLSNFFLFYINASIHVAFSVVALVGITVIELQLDVPKALWVFVFFGTITGYNFVKYATIAGLHHRSLAQSLRAIQVFSAISLAAVLLSVFFLDLSTILITCLLGLITFFYAVPLFYKKNLRTLSGIKIFAVALVWAGSTVALPVVADGLELATDIYIIFIQRLLIVLVLTLPFEIRDLTFDQIQLNTIPQRYGIRKTKVLGITLLTVVVLLDGFKDALFVSSLYSLVLVVLVTGWALLVAQKKQSEYFASFWVESIPIIWCCLLLLFRHFLA